MPNLVQNSAELQIVKSQSQHKKQHKVLIKIHTTKFTILILGKSSFFAFTKKGRKV
jgi:hypothetical protein